MNPVVIPDWLLLTIGVAVGAAVIWGALIAVLWVQQRRAGRDVDWREIARLAPDVVRLVTRLSRDPAVPRATRWWLIGLLAYLLLPIDVVPDFIPILGFADDAVAIVIALRYAVRSAGEGPIRAHWPGTAAGLDALLALTARSVTAR